MIEKDCTKLSGWKAVKCVWYQYSHLWIVPAFLAGFILGTIIPFGGDFFESFKPELLSILLTVTVLYGLDRWRQDKLEEKRIKEELLWQAKSQSNEIAKSAIDRIRHKGWLTGDNGLLKGADLHDAKLVNANLYEANLEGANLLRANLKYTNLSESDLTSAVSYGANLTNADLRGAKLEDALLAGANLTNVKLNRANLNNSDLRGAILIGADLQNAKLNDVIWKDADFLKDINDNPAIAILPDGTKSTENPDTTRFTDPEHPDFWQPPQDE